MMTTRRKKNVQKYSVSSEGPQGGGRDIFTGALAPVGPCVEPPLVLTATGKSLANCAANRVLAQVVRLTHIIKVPVTK